MRTDDDLERFVDAQRGVIDAARAELAAGCKTSHWMWFVFPQLRGLGHSATARYYGIGSTQEAADFLAHPVLGPRLAECVRLLLAHDHSAHEILGSPDDLKLRSSLTLFALVAPHEPLFAQALQKFFGGTPDPLTVDRLARGEGR